MTLDYRRLVGTRASGYNSRGASYESSYYLNDYSYKKIAFNNSGLGTTDIPDQFINRKPIEFSIELADSLADFIGKNLSKDLRFLTIPKYITDITGNEFKRFLCALESYRQSPNPVLPMSFLIDGLRDKLFASYLKEIRDKSFRWGEGFEYFSTPDNFYDTDFTKINDIGDIFNYNYWFFWQEDKVDDFKYSKIPLKGIQDSDLDQFEDKLYTLLPDHVEEIDEEEILISTSGSVCYNPGKGKYVYEVKQKHNRFSDKPLQGKRSCIFVSPDNTRDSVILPVEQSNSVKLIEKQVARIAEKVRGSAYVRDDQLFKEILEQFFDPEKFYLDRDIKKEGLTKPRELIMSVLKVLKIKYPKFKAWRYSNIFSHFSIIDYDNEVVSLERGCGLGMSNAITTLIQVVVFELCLDKLEEEFGSIARSCKCIAYNDDFTARFDYEYLSVEYWDIEDSWLSRLDIIRNEKKSFRKRGGFSFCERYFPQPMGEKVSYRLTEFNNAFAATNIAAAKMYVNNLSRNVHPYSFEDYIKELTSFWGYEFFYGEWNRPYLLGGWVTPVINLVDLSFAVKEDEITDEEEKAFFACKKPFYSFRKISRDETRYKSPLETITHRDDLVIPEKFNNYVNYGVKKSEVDSLYLMRNNDQYLNRMLSAYRNARENAYHMHEPQKLNKSELFEIIFSENPDIDYLPPLGSFTKGEVKFTEPDESDYWITPSTGNTIMSMVKYFNPDKLSEKYIPFLNKELTGYMYRNFKLSDQEFLSNRLFKDCSYGFIEATSRYRYIHSVQGNPCGYVNSNNVINACFFVYKMFCYPLCRHTEKTRERFNKFPLVEQILSHRKLKRVFLLLVKAVGFSRSYEAYEKYGVEFIQEFCSLLKPEEPVRDEYDEFDEDGDRDRYYFWNYAKWIQDGRPMWMPYTEEPLHSFLIISMIREQVSHARDGSYTTGVISEDFYLEFVEENRLKIELGGGVIHQPRPNYVFISYPEIDPDSDDEESQDEIDIFSD